MQTLTPLDWAILAVLVISTVMAFLHGFLVEVCALIGLVGGIILAGQYYLQLVPWVQHFVHEDAAAAANRFSFDRIRRYAGRRNPRPGATLDTPRPGVGLGGPHCRGGLRSAQGIHSGGTGRRCHGRIFSSAAVVRSVATRAILFSRGTRKCYCAAAGPGR